MSDYKDLYYQPLHAMRDILVILQRTLDTIDDPCETEDTGSHSRNMQ